MRNIARRSMISATLLAAGGFLFSTVNTGCLSFGAESLLQAADFCFIFNCNGILGGTIDPCSGVGTDTNTVESENANPIFTDCLLDE
ncbi:MAG: hypothetical protein ACPGXK_06855 [Phycisphaerae bacterium]